MFIIIPNSSSIFFRITFLIFFGYFFWIGLVDLIFHIEYSINYKEINNITKNKKVIEGKLWLKNGLMGGDRFITYKEPGVDFLNNIIYPLISEEQSNKEEQTKPILIKILILLPKQSNHCVDNGGYCIPYDNTSIYGIVRPGSDYLKGIDLKGLESQTTKISKNFVLIERLEPARMWYWDLFLVSICTLFEFTILKTFLRKASSLKEYLTKVVKEEEI